MTLGTLYGIGVGPGDPEWITVKAVPDPRRPAGTCACRESGLAADSVALEIARNYLRPDAVVHEQSFPMTADADLLRQHWQTAARQVYEIAVPRRRLLLPHARRRPAVFHLYLSAARAAGHRSGGAGGHGAGRDGLQRGGRADQLPRWARASSW